MDYNIEPAVSINSIDVMIHDTETEIRNDLGYISNMLKENIDDNSHSIEKLNQAIIDLDSKIRKQNEEIMNLRITTILEWLGILLLAVLM